LEHCVGMWSASSLQIMSKCNICTHLSCDKEVAENARKYPGCLSSLLETTTCAPGLHMQIGFQDIIQLFGRFCMGCNYFVDL
jgi:hypothetical protein